MIVPAGASGGLVMSSVTSLRLLDQHRWSAAVLGATEPSLWELELVARAVVAVVGPARSGEAHELDDVALVETGEHLGLGAVGLPDRDDALGALRAVDDVDERPVVVTVQRLRAHREDGGGLLDRDRQARRRSGVQALRLPGHV